MPIYEYECANCGKGFETLVRSQREEQQLACPHCGAGKIKRKPSVFSTHAAAAPLPPGACGRCGDPNGSCGMD